MEGHACGLLLQVLFTKSSCGEHLLAFSSLLQWRGLPASCYYRLCLLKARVKISSLPLPCSPVHSEHPVPSAASPFQFLVYYLGFFCLFVFAWQGSVCLGGYAGLSLGWQWEYGMLLICSPVGLHLPSRFGAGVWQLRSPPGFSV
jgi:hypothetical protein